MVFGEAIKSGYMKMFDFSGRAGRSEFWWFQLYYSILTILVEITVDQSFAVVEPIGLSLSLFLMISLVAALAVSVRRLHDTERSGLWMFLVFVPIIGAFYLLYLFVLSGGDGANKYGGQPGYDAELGLMSPVERSERIANDKLDTEDKLVRFLDAFDQQQFQACWDVLEEAGVENKDIHCLITGIREQGFVPSNILGRRK